MGRVLLIEDEKLVKNATISMLTLLGYDADSCENFQEAIKLFQKSLTRSANYNIVIVDLVLDEGTSGIDVFNSLRQKDPSITGILSTGYVNDVAVESYQNYGFSALLLKPYDINDLAAIMDQFLNRP